MQHQIKQYDLVRAAFKPKRVENLKPGLTSHIGKIATWQTMYRITEEDNIHYAGQWAMMPFPQGEAPWFKYAWVPDEDLEIIELVDRLVPDPDNKR